jgi:protein disulfide isomerase
MRTLLLGCLLVAGLAAASDVVDTKDANFDEVINSHEFVLMEFYAPWCGHCKKLAPEWEAAATQLKGKAVIAKIDATAEPANAAKFEIRGYPSIKVFRDGKLSGDYEGQRTADAIVKYVKGNAGPAVTEVSTEAELEALKQENSVLAVLFGGEGEASKAFGEAAKKYRSTYRFVSSAVLGDATANSLVVFKHFDEKKETFSGEITAEAIGQFVSNAGIRLFDEIGPENYKMYMERGLPMAWLFVTPGKDETQPAKDSITAIAKDFKGKVSFVWIDASKYGGMAQRLGLSGDKFPALAIDKEGTHFVYSGESIETAAVKEFVDSFLEGKLTQTIRSEKEPAEHTVDGLTTVVGNTFQALVTDSEVPVLIEFYAPWCGHCKQLAPTYAKVAKAAAGQNVRIAQIDATANDFPQKTFSVQGFPTIYFARKGEEPKQYEGDRSFDGFAKFLKANADVTIAE